MHRTLTFLMIMVFYSWGTMSSASVCETTRSWPAWEQTQARMVTSDGRIVDHSDPRLITTSEGQSYAMFFALVNNDRKLFQRLFQWTQDYLAKGDLSSNLPSWLWGRLPDARWGLLDDNSASDSDLWIAYSLLEAGRLWHERAYSVIGNQLLALIASREVIDLPDFGLMLLPGAHGFVQNGVSRLNPSYLPPQLVQRLAQGRQAPWLKIAQNTPKFLLDTAPNGLAPNWISWTTQDKFKATSEQEVIGSYDAIRVYLWVGMLADDAKHAAVLKRHFMEVGRFVNEKGQVAEEINVQTGNSTAWAGPGFSSALLPLFKGQAIEARLLANLENNATNIPGYYNQMLMLFGQGWFEQRYRFDAQGHLMPAWVNCQ